MRQKRYALFITPDRTVSTEWIVDLKYLNHPSTRRNAHFFPNSDLPFRSPLGLRLQQDYVLPILLVDTVCTNKQIL